MQLKIRKTQTWLTYNNLLRKAQGGKKENTKSLNDVQEMRFESVEQEKQQGTK